MNFERQNLSGDHYHWERADSNEMFSGHPSRRKFDRFNGDQVLFLINSYAVCCNEFSAETGQLLEKEIKDHLPISAKSEISVLNWLLQKFKSK